MASGTRPITLLQAVNSNDVASVSKILAEKKIQINFTDNHNFCALHHAVCKRNVDIVKVLLNYRNINTRIKSYEGLTVLQLATTLQDMPPEIVELLLSKDPHLVTICNKEEVSPLQEAVKNQSFELVKILVKFGAPLNYKDLDGETSLHYAASTANYEIIEFLLTNGADPTINNNDELNPLCVLLARTFDKEEQIILSCFLLLLTNTYAKDPTTDNYDVTEVFKAAFLGCIYSHESVVRYLIHHTYSNNNSKYWIIEKMEQAPVTFLFPGEFRNYINIFLHDRIRKYDEFKFARFTVIHTVMCHRALLYTLRRCLVSDELLSLAIQLLEHLDTISFDVKSREFSLTFGLTFLGAFVIASSFDDFKRIYKLIEHFHGRFLDVNVMLTSFLQAVAITSSFNSIQTHVPNILKTLLPFCTNFFSNQNHWAKEINSFYQLNPVIKETVDHLLQNFGNQENYKSVPNCVLKIFPLQHLARNKIRDLVLANSTGSIEFLRNISSLEIPFSLRQFLRFQDNEYPVFHH